MALAVSKKELFSIDKQRRQAKKKVVIILKPNDKQYKLYTCFLYYWIEF